MSMFWVVVVGGFLLLVVLAGVVAFIASASGKKHD